MASACRCSRALKEGGVVRSRFTIIALAALALLVGAAGAEVAPPPAGLIYSCVSNAGDVKVVTQSKLCSSLNSGKTTWSPLNWNGTGPAGPQGAAGPAGAAGPP